MIERYIVQESIEFCSDYKTKAKTIRIAHKWWLNKCFISKSIWGVNVVTKDWAELLQVLVWNGDLGQEWGRGLDWLFKTFLKA